MEFFSIEVQAVEPSISKLIPLLSRLGCAPPAVFNGSLNINLISSLSESFPDPSRSIIASSLSPFSVAS